MKARALAVAYWDTSAILSALFRDAHSEEAVRFARTAGVHLISTLAWAEAYAVCARIEREGALATVLVDAARNVLVSGPWRRVNVVPDWNTAAGLARSWPLRGAELWHLAAVKALQPSLPDLRMLTFDQRLAIAANGEGL